MTATIGIALGGGGAKGLCHVSMLGVLDELWDAAPLLPIVSEAGGHFTDWRGEVTAFGGDSIATNAALSARVRSILQEEPR
jgi:fructose-1,6-bisphosphatase/inositol monophosphatase family enzyme